jgi:hypothetical protein
MIIKEQLKDFFKLGLLDNISYGLTRDELTNILGDTDWKHFSSNKDKFPSMYKYGRLEFYFTSNNKDAGLSGIMFQPIPFPANNCLLKCNYHRLTKNTDIEKAIEFLKTNNIEYEEKPYEWDKNAKLLFTEGKVNIFFDCQETLGYYVLHKAGRFVDL